jgi:hypothetical protein
MTPQEAEIIRSVFARLKAMGPAPADAEAAGLVEAQLAADRGAGLALVRALVMTDQARAGLAAENEALKQEIERLEAGRGQGDRPGSGGLFGGAGPWGVPQPPQQQPQPRPPAPGPWGGPEPTTQPGGGFWSNALRTGAGVAGGLFAFEALRGLFGGGHGGWGGYGPSAGLFGGGPTTVVNETVNVFENDRDGAETGGGFFGGGGEPTRSAGLLDDDSDGFSGDDDGGSLDGGDDWA